MKKGLLALSIVILTCLPAMAQRINVDSLMRVPEDQEPLHRQMVTLTGGFNISEESSLAFELDYAWYALRYVGVGIGFEIDDDYGERGLINVLMDDVDNDDYDPDRIVKLNFHPMLTFRTPTLWMNRRHGWGLLLRCDPGLVMSVPVNDSFYRTEIVGKDEYGHPVVDEVKVSNRDGKWLFWRVRTMLSARSGCGLVSLGWSLSNYNIAYCRNHLYKKGVLVSAPSHFDKTFSLFLSFSYTF